MPAKIMMLLFLCLSLMGCSAGEGLGTLFFLGFVVYLISKASSGAEGRSEKNTDGKANNGKAGQGLISIQVTTSWDQRANAKAGEWVISNKAFDFQGISIPNPMFYAGKISRDEYPDPALINTALPIAKKRKEYVQELGYWPSYSDMTPDQRRRYIDWLSNGRKDPSIDIGYVFIFYYGLERRLLVDRQDGDKILAELHRLRDIYDNRSFQNYSSDLIAFNSLLHIKKIKEDSVLKAFPKGVNSRSYSEDTLNAVLYWYMIHEKPLPWVWAIVVAENDPRSPSSVVTKRVKREFEQLFKERYKDKHDDGIILKSSKRMRTFYYNPASSTLSSMRSAGRFFEFKMPNMLGLPSQFKPLVNIWTQCIDDLKAYSRKQAKESEDTPLTADAWEKLPPELQNQFDHPAAKAWSTVIEKYIDDGSTAWIPTSELAALQEIPVRDRLTVGQSTKLAETAKNLGYAVEPDARLTRSGYLWGPKLAVYHDAEPDGHLDAKSPYSAASVMLHLALSIASADEIVVSEELETITKFLDNQFNLTDSEQRRLIAFKDYLLQSKISLTGVGKRIQAHLDDNQRHKVGQFLIAVAAADGVFEKSEIQALKKAYKAMGMDPNDAINEIKTITAITTDQEKPILVRKGKSGKPGETIPPQPAESTSEEPIKLDPKAIAKIIDDTKDVGEMLGKILAESDDAGSLKPPPTQTMKQHAEKSQKQEKTSAQQPSEAAKSATKISIAGLPSEYRPFIKDVVKKGFWSEDEFRSLADKHKVMINGAIDAINEWSEEEVGDYLWEQGFKNPPKTSAQNRPSSHLNIPLRRWRKPKSTELCWRFEAQTACIF